jgi:hypothetical protein
MHVCDVVFIFDTSNGYASIIKHNKLRKRYKHATRVKETTLTNFEVTPGFDLFD